MPPDVLRVSRAWSEDDWATAVEGLRSRGIVAADDDALAFTDEGRDRRQWVEDRTDALSTAAYEALGEDGCDRLRQLARPFSKAIVSSGLLSMDLSEGSA